MRILVTGGAGFIGSHITEELVKQGHSVTVYDNFSTGKKEHLAEVQDKITLHQADICDFSTLKTACKDIDIILHQAALRSVPASVDNPPAYNKVNIEGTYNVLEAARQTGIKRVVFASSSSVYGAKPKLPQKVGKEDTRLSPYAISKYTGEDYCKYFHYQYGLTTIALRYFNVYGPRQDPYSQYAAVIPAFILALLNNKQPVIYGTGEQSRDFSYIKDVVTANILAMTNKKLKSNTFNIGGGQPISINTLAQNIASILGSNLTPEYLPARQGDVLHTSADLTKTKKILGLTQTTPFNDALKETVTWFAQKYKPK